MSEFAQTSPRSLGPSPDHPFYFSEMRVSGRLVFDPFQHAIDHAAQKIVSLSGSVHRRWTEARNRAVLNSMSDHALKDLGLHRSEIQRVAADVERGVDPRRSAD